MMDMTQNEKQSFICTGQPIGADEGNYPGKEQWLVKKKLKGFTLVEMIMVLALFSIIMYSVLELMTPVSKFFVRSSNFESNTACVDNIKRAIEGNLKYADRVRVYYNFGAYTVNGAGELVPSEDMETRVKNFYKDYFKSRKATDAAGYIYVLALNNEQQSLDGIEDLTSFQAKQINGGKISLFKFWYNNYDDRFNDENKMFDSLSFEATDTDKLSFPNVPNVLPEPGYEEWYVNQKLYNNYEFRYDLGMVEQKTATVDDLGNVVKDADDNPVETPLWIKVVNTSDGQEVKEVFENTGWPAMKEVEGGSASTFNPSDFTLTISMNEVRRNSDDSGLSRFEVPDRVTCTFSMKNVLDITKGFDVPADDYKLLMKDLGGDDVVDAEFNYVAEVKPRYETMKRNPGSEDSPRCDQIFFIYTLPDTCYDNGSYVTKQKMSGASGT